VDTQGGYKKGESVKKEMEGRAQGATTEKMKAAVQKQAKFLSTNTEKIRRNKIQLPAPERVKRKGKEKLKRGSSWKKLRGGGASVSEPR